MTQCHALVEQLHLVCLDVLGRTPTPAELGAWRNRLVGGMTVAQVRHQLARSGEARLVYYLAGLSHPHLAPELRQEALAKVRKGTAVEDVVASLTAELARRSVTGWRPAPSPRPVPGSTGARGYRTPAPGCA